MGLIDNKNNFSINLRKYRILAGYTQTELAAKLGMTRQNYIRYENESINAQPTIELLCKLADILNTDVNTLIGYKSSIDTETAYKMFDIKIRKNEIVYFYNLSLYQRDKTGFDVAPYQKTIPISMPKKKFDVIILDSYKFAYHDATTVTEKRIRESFIANVENEIYNDFIINLLEKNDIN